MEKMYRQGLQTMANRDKYANVGEAVAVIMANSLHTNKSSNQLIELRLKREASRLYQKLLEGTYQTRAGQKDDRHCVCFNTCAGTLSAIRLDEDYKMLVLDVLTSQPNRDQSISEKDFVTQVVERVHRTQTMSVSCTKIE